LERMRAFIAIELPEAIRSGLQQEIETLRALPSGRAVRWASASGIHVTLKFLGEVAADRTDDIVKIMADVAAGHSPFELCVRGLGAFPNVCRPRVVWMGTQDRSGQLAHAQKELEDRLSRVGFERESRAFNPHLTLGRVRREASGGDVEHLGQALATAPEIGEFLVEGLSLMRSELHPSGAVYSRIGQAPLGGAH